MNVISHDRPAKKGASPVLAFTISIHVYNFCHLIFIWFLSKWNHQCLGIRVGTSIYDHKSFLQNVMGASSDYLGSIFTIKNLDQIFFINKLGKLIIDIVDE